MQHQIYFRNSDYGRLVIEADEMKVTGERYVFTSNVDHKKVVKAVFERSEIAGVVFPT